MGFLCALSSIREAERSHRVMVVMEDHRYPPRQATDKLVSIEMIEAVRWQHLGPRTRACLSSPAARPPRAGMRAAAAATVEAQFR